MDNLESPNYVYCIFSGGITKQEYVVETHWDTTWRGEWLQVSTESLIVSVITSYIFCNFIFLISYVYLYI